MPRRLWAIVWALMWVACDDPQEATPTVDAGAICACSPGETCLPDGLCAPAPDPTCTPTCDEAGWVCGERCGRACGTCDEGQHCAEGACVCTPSCAVETCEQANGCGGQCGPCPSEVGCADCALRLSVVEVERQAGANRFVTVALDYAPPDGAPRPGIADLRLKVQGDAELLEVALGAQLLAAHKTLFADPETGRAFRALPDDVVQLLVLSTENTTLIDAGRWLFLRFRVGPAFGDATGPAIISLVPRAEILAPPPADQVLWGADLGVPVVVWP
jgi:hypothetical protein